MPAGGVFDLPGARVRMMQWHLGGGERQAKEPTRGLEGRLDHALELEERLDLGLVQIELGLAALLGVIAPVVSREGEIAALLRDHLLQGIALGGGLGAVSAPDILKQ